MIARVENGHVSHFNESTLEVTMCEQNTEVSKTIMHGLGQPYYTTTINHQQL